MALLTSLVIGALLVEMLAVVPPVRATNPVQAAFTPANQIAGSSPQSVAFRDTSTGAPVAWEWRFGDGDTSTEQHPRHVYRSPGRYTVQLTARAADGSTDTQIAHNVVVVDQVLSRGLVAQPDAAFGSTITNAAAITDNDIGTAASVCPAAPNNGFWYDLGSARWITRTAVRATHSTSAYSSRIAVWATNVDPTTGTPNWTKIYDTLTNIAEAATREFVVDAANAGPWRYMRFQMVSRNVNSACNNWATAETYGADPTTVTDRISAQFESGRSAGPLPGFNSRTNLVRSPSGDGPTVGGYRAAVTDHPQLVTLYSFEEGSGAQAAIDSASDNDAAASGSVLPGQFGFVSDSWAARFGGSGTYQDATPASIPAGASPRTVEFWYRGTSTTRQTVVSYGATVLRQTFGVVVNLNGANRIGLTTYGNDNAVLAPGINDGGWHHVAATYDGNLAVQFYLDGRPLGGYTTGGVLDTVISSSGLVIGRDHHATGSYLSGDIDEVAIYGAALSETQLRAHVDAGAAVRYSTNEERSQGYSPQLAANGVATNSAAEGESWSASGAAAGDWWRVDWAAPQQFDTVRLWDRAGSTENFGAGKLVFSDGSEVAFAALPNDAAEFGASFREITFAPKTGIRWMQVVTQSGFSGNVGLAEVVAFDSAVPANEGLAVEFRDLSTGHPVAWSWNFGDGTYSNQRNPVHYFGATGAYTVSLRVTDAAGESSTKTTANYVVMERPLSDGIVPTPQNGAGWFENTSGTVATGAEVTDTNAGSYDHLSGCCPQTLQIDLGETLAVSRVQVKTSHDNSASYRARQVLWGSMDGQSWVQLHDDMVQINEGQVREIRLEPHAHGPWRYMRVEMRSRSTHSAQPRWYQVRVFGAGSLAPTGDVTVPSAAFVAPALNDTVSQATGVFSVDWTATDGQSGVSRQQLQRQRAPADSGTCPTPDVDWSNHGDSRLATPPVEETSLAAGYCYRWHLVVTDGTGNATVAKSGNLIVDTTAPDAPSLTDNTTLVSGTFRSGDVVFFDNVAAGSIDLTATGSDTTSSVISHSYTQGHDPSASGSQNGDPQTRPVAWSADQGEFSVSVTSTNAAGLTSPPATLTFTPDAADPVVAFGNPAPDSRVRTAARSLSVTWSELEEESGVTSRALQRQRAASDGLGACESATFVNDGAAIANESPVAVSGLEPGYCYRWHLHVADAANRSADATSGILFVEAAPAPVTGFTNPAPDYAVAVDNDFEDSDALAGWPGTRVTVGSDREMSLGGSTVDYFGPKFDAESGQIWRTSMRAFPAGPHAYFGICFFRADGSVVSCPESARISAGDQRADVTTRVATAPADTVKVGIRFYHAYYTSFYDDVRLEQVTTDVSAVQVANGVTIAWTETQPEHGLNIASRSLQRQTATATDIGGCAAANFSNDGPAIPAVSPVEQAGLLSGSCYRWLQTLTDADGAASTTTSGVVYVVDHALDLRFTPNSRVGETAFVSVVIVDRAGNPVDDYSGSLTLATTDSGAVFPAGPTHQMRGPGDLTGHTFPVQFTAIGEHTITARGSAAAGDSATITLGDTALSASAPATAYAGVPFLVTVTPLADGVHDPLYAATVQFASSDPTAEFPGLEGAPPSFTFACSCEKGDDVLTVLNTVGQQTVTVVDSVGNSDSVQVQVLPAPGPGAPSPIERVDTVQWRHGTRIDFYVTAHAGAQPFTIVNPFHTCGLSGHEGGGIGLRVDPAADRHVEFTVTVPGELADGFCSGPHLAESSSHLLIVTDASGNEWAQPMSQRHLRFSSVPGGANFRTLNAGDPVASMTTSARGFNGSIEIANGEAVLRSQDTLDLVFDTYSPVRTYDLNMGRPGIHPYSPLSGAQGLPAGQSVATFDEYTWGCHPGPSFLQLNSGWVRYTDSSGYTGAFASAGNFVSPLSGPAPEADPICIDNAPPVEWDGLLSLFDGLSPENGGGFDLERMMAADPIDPFSGAYTQPVNDFALGGRQPSLSLTRTYRSDRAERAAAGDSEAIGAFGPGWGANIDQRLTFKQDGNRVEWRTPDGGVVVFTRNSSGEFSSLQTGFDLTAITGGWHITSDTGSVVAFDTSGRLAAVRDALGNQQTFAYDANARLDSFTDAAGRTADVTTDSAGRLVRVDLPDGRYVAFAYDSRGHLSTARSLSGTVLTYVTDVRGRVTAVSNAEGDPLVQNTYDDRGRVIAQADANGETTWFIYSEERLTQVIDPRGARTSDCFLPSGQLTDRVDALGGAREWTYDSAGHPASETDQLGNTTRFQYDAEGRPTAVTDALGRTQTITYDASGRAQTIVDHAGNRVSMAYTNGLPTTVVRSEPASDPTPQSLVISEYTWSAAGLPLTMTQAGGSTTTFEYDSVGNLVAVIDPEGRRTTYTVDARGLLIAAVDPLGNAPGGVAAEHTMTSTYDDAGRVLTATNQEGETTTYTYDDMGRLTTVTSPRGAITTNSYDDEGRLLSSTRQLNAAQSATTSFDYDPTGNLLSVTDAEGRTVEFEYDLLGRQTLRRDANGEEWHTEYDAAGHVVRVTDPTGRSVRSVFDAAGRLTRTVDPADEQTNYSYDSFDQLIAITDPLGRVTTSTYDWLGRQTTTTNAGSETTTLTYDDAGNVTSVLDPLSHLTEFTYDASHLLLSVTDAADGETTYAYDAAGRLVERTNARTNSETFAYDAVGRPTVVADALGNDWTTVYDADGNVDYTVDANGQQTDFVYDLAGRLLTIDPATGASITFSNDDTGRQLSMTDGEGVTTFAYDNNGLITTADRNGQAVTYAYDAAGRPVSVGYPNNGGAVTYGYDTAGRVASLTDWANRTTTLAYDDASRVTSMTRPGGLISSFTYDAVDRPLSITHSRNGSSLLALSYTYDDVGNVATYTDDTGTASFAYNALDQLTAADYPGANDFTYGYDAAGNMTATTGPSGSMTRTFDAADRLITETSSAESEASVPALTTAGAWTDHSNAVAADDSYATAAPAVDSSVSMSVDSFDFTGVPTNAVVTDVTVELEWHSSLAAADLTLAAQAKVDGDLVGTETTDAANPTTDTAISFAVADLTRADLENLDIVIQARRGTGAAGTASLDAVSVDVTYTLPPRALTYDANGSLLDDGAGRTFTYDALGRTTAVTGGPANATYRYDGAGRRVGATVDGVTTDFLLDVRGLGSVLSDGTRRYLPGAPNAGYEEGGVWRNSLANAQGSVLGEVDTAGALGALMHFDPYGGALPEDTPTNSGPGYTGEWTDATGLVDLRFRLYDPLLQHFMGRDTFAGTASAPLTGNRYAYVGGNPLRYTDPSGHLWNEFWRDPGFYLSLGIQMVPFVGDAYSLFIGLTGYDPIAGIKLSDVERLLAIGAAFLPGGGFQMLGGAASRLAGGVMDILGGGIRRLAGSLDNIALRGLDDLITPGLRALPSPGSGGRLVDDVPVSGGRQGDAVPDAGGAGPACKPGNSFVPLTRVLMADGSTKAISEVEEGDWVLAEDPETGERGARRVTDVIVGQGLKELVEIEIDGETLTATDGHPFWVTGDAAWTDAEDLAPGDNLRLSNGSTAVVDAIVHYASESVVHNFTVDDIHTYFVVVGGDAALVHNCGQYEVAFEARLADSSYPGTSRARHFQEANTNLLHAMDADPQFAAGMEELIPGLRSQLSGPRSVSRKPPTGWTWHHAETPGVMQLVPSAQHAPGSSQWGTLHPGGRGGYAIWGSPGG